MSHRWFIEIATLDGHQHMGVFNSAEGRQDWLNKILDGKAGAYVDLPTPTCTRKIIILGAIASMRVVDQEGF